MAASFDLERTPVVQVLDPRGTGHADMDVLADMLARLPGIHSLSVEVSLMLLHYQAPLKQGGAGWEMHCRACTVPSAHFCSPQLPVDHV